MNAYIQVPRFLLIFIIWIFTHCAWKHKGILCESSYLASFGDVIYIQ